jgi:hypothetical protein
MSVTVIGIKMTKNAKFFSFEKFKFWRDNYKKFEVETSCPNKPDLKRALELKEEGNKLYKENRDQCYKTFCGRKLRLFIIARAFVPGKAFQPSVMFAGMARAYPSEAHFRCSTLRQASGLSHKH